jgi:hypothetical protein
LDEAACRLTAEARAIEQDEIFGGAHLPRRLLKGFWRWARMDWGPMHAPNSEIRRDEINARADCPLFQAANHWLVQYLSREFQVEVDKALRDSAAPRPAGQPIGRISQKKTECSLRENVPDDLWVRLRQFATATPQEKTR